MPATTDTEHLVYVNDPTWGFINAQGNRCYLLAEPHSPQDVKKHGYRFTADITTAWKFPTQAKAIQKAIIVNRHIGWSSQGLHKMSTMPANQFPSPTSGNPVNSVNPVQTSGSGSGHSLDLHSLAKTSTHGGPRTPAPGKKNGRPKKKPQAKSVSTTIVLSSPKALKALKRLAKRAHLTPGALIERELLQ